MMPIAIYHLSIKIISRGKGKSAVAAAAYRAGEKIHNEYDGVTHDYTRKGGIAFSEILLPKCAPPEYVNRSILWNAVEKIEKAKNSQLAREIEIALPNELSMTQNISLVRDYVKTHFADKGMCADICIHNKNNNNPHAHIMLTMRPFTKEKTWGDKQKKEYVLDINGNKIYDPKKRQYKCKSIPTTDWNEQSKAEEWRESWAVAVNIALKENGVDMSIDHRSYERQGVNQIPTLHLGVSASQMEKKGMGSNRGDINREIEVSNNKLKQINARMKKLQRWLDDEIMEADRSETPTLVAVMENILSRKNYYGDYTNAQALRNIKDGANILNFLTKNNINDVADLDVKLKSMFSERSRIVKNLNDVDRRIKTLKEHLRQSEIHKKYRQEWQKYRKQPPKKQEEYYEKHRMGLALYRSADNYFKGVLNGRTTIPINTWRKELDGLALERKVIHQEYVDLKDDVSRVEKIRVVVGEILRVEKSTIYPIDFHDISLS